MPEFLHTGLLPLLFIALFFMGAFLYFYGRKYMIEPSHSIRVAMEQFEALSRLHKERMKKSRRKRPGKRAASRATSDRLKDRIIDEESAAGVSPGEIPLPDGVDDADAPSHGMKRFPIHDAPLWILAYLSTLFGYVVLAGAAIWGEHVGEPRGWLEKLVLERLPLIRRLHVGQRLSDNDLMYAHQPLVEFLFYLLAAYLFLLLLGNLYARLFRTNGLHLLAEVHPLRRTVKWLWRACGFIDFRKLDRGAHAWLIRPVLFLAFLLIAVDLLAFFERIDVHPGGLAMAHLFFLSLVRMFDETWLYPLGFEQKPHKVYRKTPLEHLAANVHKNGALPAPPTLIHTIAPSTGPFRDAPEVSLPPVVNDFLAALTGKKRLWDHQAAGWKSVFQDQAGVILCGPTGSGKSTWTRLLAVNEIISRAGGVLMILPDRKALNREVALMRRAVESSGIRWNLTVFDASDPEFLSMESAVHPPLLVLADPPAIEKTLLRHFQKFPSFWRLLSRIVVDDIHRLNGVQTSNFYYLLRRLLTIRNRKNNRPAALCGVCSRVSRVIEDEVEKLLGRPLTFITADAAPAVPILLYRIPCDLFDQAPDDAPDDASGDASSDAPGDRPGVEEHFSFTRSASIITQLGAGIRKEGYDAWYDPRLISRHEIEEEHALGAWTPILEPNPNPVSAPASILLVDHENLLNIADDIRHHGAMSGESVHVCFLLVSHNPAAWYFLHHPDELFSSARDRIYRNFFFNPENSFLIERSLEGALGNAPLSRPQLERIFGREIMNAKLTEMIEEERVEEIKEAGRTFAGCCLLKNRKFPPDLDFDTVNSRALELIRPSQSIDALVFKGEEAYIRSQYYPGRIFLHEGQRCVVRKVPSEDSGSTTVEIDAGEEQHLITSKIRTMDVDFKGKAFRSRAMCCTLPGGASIHIEYTNAAIRETILGYRTWSANLEPVSTVLYEKTEAEKEISLTTHNQVMLIGFDWGKEEPDKAVLRLLVRLWRTLLPGFFQGDLDQPDIFLVESADSAAGAGCIGVRELYPGGVGLLKKHDDAQILRYFTLSRKILDALPNDMSEALLKDFINDMFV